MQVADLLGWEALDHELLDAIAEQFHAPVQLMEVMDEQPAHWLSEILNQGLVHRKWSSQTFVHRVAQAIQLAVHSGNCVIVGRGAQYLLPHENGLFVRLIGALSYRIEATATRDGNSKEEAKAKVESLDKQRIEFVDQYFHHDVTDLYQYDLVVNVEKLGARTASLIAGAYKSRFGS